MDSLQVEEGATLSATVEGEIRDLMSRLVTNEQDVVPLGALALPLRARYEPRVAEDAVERIVARVEEIRSGGAASAPTNGGSPEEAEPGP